jgi:hypothetical protein
VRWLVAFLAALSSCAEVAPAFADESVCVCPSDGWRADESLDDRIHRLERVRSENEIALKLARAEKTVREKQKRRAR